MLIVAVFDIDGVLVDPSKRLKKCLEEQGAKFLKDLDRARKQAFWECFLSDKYMDLDEPIIENIRYVQKLKENGVKIVLLTGRREDTQKTATLMQIKKWKIPCDKIYFRRKNDRRKDYIYKANILKLLLKRNYKIVEIWDDMEDVAKKLKEISPKTKVILYNPHIKQKTIL
mgnify:CR=1 FL=1